MEEKKKISIVLEGYESCNMKFVCIVEPALYDLELERHQLDLGLEQDFQKIEQKLKQKMKEEEV